MNQYTYRVPFTEDELMDCYVNQGMTQTEIAKKYGTSQKVVWRAMQRAGIVARKAAARNQKGIANNNWRGGRTLMAKTATRPKITDGGYWYVYKPDHPNAKRTGYIAEHILVATEAAGRPLELGEVVHHVNLNKHDNRPENLVICGRQRHALLHNQLEEIAVFLMNNGQVVFDPENGYRLLE